MNDDDLRPDQAERLRAALGDIASADLAAGPVPRLGASGPAAGEGLAPVQALVPLDATPERRRRRGARLLATAAVVAVLGGAGVVWSQRDTSQPVAAGAATPVRVIPDVPERFTLNSVVEQNMGLSPVQTQSLVLRPEGRPDSSIRLFVVAPGAEPVVDASPYPGETLVGPPTTFASAVPPTTATVGGLPVPAPPGTAAAPVPTLLPPLPDGEAVPVPTSLGVSTKTIGGREVTVYNAGAGPIGTMVQVAVGGCQIRVMAPADSEADIEAVVANVGCVLPGGLSFPAGVGFDVIDPSDQQPTSATSMSYDDGDGHQLMFAALTFEPGVDPVSLWAKGAAQEWTSTTIGGRSVVVLGNSWAWQEHGVWLSLYGDVSDVEVEAIVDGGTKVVDEATWQAYIATADVQRPGGDEPTATTVQVAPAECTPVDGTAGEGADVPPGLRLVPSVVPDGWVTSATFPPHGGSGCALPVVIWTLATAAYERQVNINVLETSSSSAKWTTTTLANDPTISTRVVAGRSVSFHRFDGIPVPETVPGGPPTTAVPPPSTSAAFDVEGGFVQIYGQGLTEDELVDIIAGFQPVDEAQWLQAARAVRPVTDALPRAQERDHDNPTAGWSRALFGLLTSPTPSAGG